MLRDSSDSTGGHTTAVKVAEAQRAIADGGTELDMVVNISRVLSGDWDYVRDDIKAVTDVTHDGGGKVKVIFENCYLEELHKIRLSEICGEIGVDWVKTSTGFGTGGAVDAEAAEKATRFLQTCDAFGLPVLSLTDTPGFMVGPDSEAQASVRRMSALFLAGAKLKVPLVAIFLRKGYGLGAMAMTAGSFARPIYTAAWPTGEFGGMGLEGAVRLGFSKELEAVADVDERAELFDQLVAQAYERGKATEAASHLEIDAVIDPAETRLSILRALAAAA